jgi:hypothetical protein
MCPREVPDTYSELRTPIQNYDGQGVEVNVESNRGPEALGTLDARSLAPVTGAAPRPRAHGPLSGAAHPRPVRRARDRAVVAAHGPAEVSDSETIERGSGRQSVRVPFLHCRTETQRQAAAGRGLWHSQQAGLRGAALHRIRVVARLMVEAGLLVSHRGRAQCRKCTPEREAFF